MEVGRGAGAAVCCCCSGSDLFFLDVDSIFLSPGGRLLVLLDLLLLSGWVGVS